MAILTDDNLGYHLSLLKLDGSNGQNEEAPLAPIFTGPVLRQPRLSPSQFGLLGGVKKIEPSCEEGADNEIHKFDPRLFFNVSSPSSTFICGSQGSGKSHTLSCMLEGCLIPSRAGRLINPLTAVVFHYDTFICDDGGSPCEAAFLASNSDIKVRVLCAPTNLRTIQVMLKLFRVIHLANESTGDLLEIQHQSGAFADRSDQSEHETNARSHGGGSRQRSCPVVYEHCSAHFEGYASYAAKYRAPI